MGGPGLNRLSEQVAGARNPRRELIRIRACIACVRRRVPDGRHLADASACGANQDLDGILVPKAQEMGMGVGDGSQRIRDDMDALLLRERD